jgi:uridine kinase
MNSIPRLAALAAGRHRTMPEDRALLVGVSGIDASGKGFVAARLAAALRRLGVRAVIINADGWLHLPGRRFGAENPGLHFYEHALRLEEMFAQLVLPLRDQRRIRLTMDYAEETASSYRKHTYDFPVVDVVIVEGIFLFKPGYRDHFDLKIWIDCSFETALERAVARGQEGLPPEETKRAFNIIYFPAQRIHAERDRPREAADEVFENDHRQLRAAGQVA